MRWLRRPYVPALRWCLRRPLVPVAVATALVSGSLFVFTHLGKEFLPELDEGDLWLRVKFPVGISLEGARPYVRDIRERLLQFPELRVVVSQLGAPDDGTDPNGPDNAEFYIGLEPRARWRFRDKDKLIEALGAALADMAGITTNFSQPIKDNVDEAMAASRASWPSNSTDPTSSPSRPRPERSRARCGTFAAWSTWTTTVSWANPSCRS